MRRSIGRSRKTGSPARCVIGSMQVETHSEASITGKDAQGSGGGRYRNRVHALTLVRYPAERTWKEEA